MLKQLLKRRMFQRELCEVEDEIMRNQIPAMQLHEYIDKMREVGRLFEKQLSAAERKEFFKGCSRIQRAIKKFVLRCNKMRKRISVIS